ncbi:uncharacterized protein LOC105845091 isoform X1 [Hydra vulgaris]|uniref:uncharacterized protein LOC105845091 isoform X1 n=1 Tax=Hydra vulgaris TaxID=6087 RepID=UPI001F5E584C|nr:uncharacterized protein LOC105845091 isoform X1 [Hydra vulgaris]
MVCYRVMFVKVLLLIVLLTAFKKVACLVVDPNQLTYTFVTEQILKDVPKYLTSVPKQIPHNFTVSFLFPELNWRDAFNDTDSDDFHCFTDKIRRRLKKVYSDASEENEYVDATATNMRDFYKGTYTIADFILFFNKEMLWPTWNKTVIASTLFPSVLAPLADVYNYPPIDSKYNPYVNYSGNNFNWFSIIENITDLAGQTNTVIYYGFYNITPPLPPIYGGPDKFSIPNIVFYSFLGFNGFVILLTLFFWFINGKRESLLLNYWIKGRDDMRRSNVEATPGAM